MIVSFKNAARIYRIENQMFIYTAVEWTYFDLAPTYTRFCLCVLDALLSDLTFRVWRFLLLIEDRDSDLRKLVFSPPGTKTFICLSNCCASCQPNWLVNLCSNHA